MKRRQIMRALAGLGLALPPRLGRAAAVGGPLTLLTGGPQDGRISRWSDAFALALSARFAHHPQIRTQPIGGLDGVTGANRLDALVVPDGKTAALLPGAALIAYLTSDPRVHFDPTRWTPLLAGSQSGVLMMRAPAGTKPDLIAMAAHMPPLRLGADQPQSNDLAALLALARLGVPVSPVFGLRGTEAKTRAFIAGEVDAVFICGEGVPEDIAPLSAAGAQAIFSIGQLGPEGTLGPDPLFPALPNILATPSQGPAFLNVASQAAAAAARLDFLVVLPRLIDPSAIALWRQAADEAADSPSLIAAASASAISLQAAPVLAASLSAQALSPADQASLRAFLAKSYGWQPG